MFHILPSFTYHLKGQQKDIHALTSSPTSGCIGEHGTPRDSAKRVAIQIHGGGGWWMGFFGETGAKQLNSTSFFLGG